MPDITSGLIGSPPGVAMTAKTSDTKNANTTTNTATPPVTTTTQTPIAIGVPPILSNIQIIPDLVAQTARVTFTTDETATSVVRVGQLVSDFERIAELDVNPLIAGPAAIGNAVADVRIRLGPVTPTT